MNLFNDGFSIVRGRIRMWMLQKCDHANSQSLFTVCTYINNQEDILKWMHLVIKHNTTRWRLSLMLMTACSHYFDSATKTHLHCQDCCQCTPAAPIVCRSWDMISRQIPSPAPALCTNELNSPWILHPSFCLCSESAEHIFPVVRVAFWKPGLQNERYGPRDLCVSIRLHAGGYCCWQVRWLHFCTSSSTMLLPLTAILLFYSNSKCCLNILSRRST